MRKIITILTFSALMFCMKNTFATAQIGDKLIFNGDTFLLFSNPLEPLLERFSLRDKMFGNNSACWTTACQRGYQAEWEIIDNYLYLTAIYSCCYSKDSIKADLKQLAGFYYNKGKIMATWFTGKLIVPQGRRILDVHDAYESVYETEKEIIIYKGRFIEYRTFDNSNAKHSIYSQRFFLLNDFINSSINWDALPNLDGKEITVYVKFSANENGVIDSTQILRGYNNAFDNEALRIVKAIPEWDVFYKKGEFIRKEWYLPIKFSRNNKNE